MQLVDSRLTFGDSKKTKKRNTIAMCSSDIISYISNREVDGPVLVVSRCYGYSSFITTQNDRAKDRVVGFRIFSN
jgi:hypothetical protein